MPELVLEGVRVLEVGTGLSSAVVGMLLAEQGADVARLVDPDRPPADPVLDAILARGKTEVSLPGAGQAGLAELDRLLSAADLAIDDRGGRDAAAFAARVAAAREAGNRGLVACRIPAFPDDDPRSALPGHDAVVGAAGTIYEKALGAPRYHDLPVPSVMAGLFAATGAVAALVARLRTGRGQDVTVTRYHSALFAQILGILMKTGVPRGFLPLRMVGTPFMRSWRCKDGRYIYVHITLPAHAARILDVLEANGHGDGVRRLREVLSADTMRDPSQVGSIAEAKRIKAIYEDIFLERTADDWERVLGMDLCCIKVRTADEWVRDSIQAGMSDAAAVDDPVFGELLVPGAGVTSPDVPPRVRPREVGRKATEVLARWETLPRDPLPAEAPAGQPGPPLAGTRVVDLSRIIAGPCAARVLAELGADVMSIQNPTGLDWALSFHLMFNAGKRSVTLDMTGEEGKRRLWAILDDVKPDALVQNYRHMDIARAVGVDPEAVRARFPSIVYTHLNAYGDRGLWKDRPGFEQVVQAVSGIQMSYGTGGVPRLLQTPVIDIGSGLSGALATVLGLYRRARTGRGAVVSTHLTWVAVLFQVQRVASAQRDRCLASARARGAAVAWDPGREVVGGIGKAADAWVCVAGPRADLDAWLRALGEPPGGVDPVAAIAARLYRRTADTWAASATRAGVAGRVAVLPVSRVRGLVEEVARIDRRVPPAVHRRPYPGCPSELTFVRGPLAMTDTPVVDVGPPPVRGGDTREVLARIGVEVPEGTGTIPYPPNRPFLPWLLAFIRWGYFAWRSGNI